VLRRRTLEVDLDSGQFDIGGPALLDWITRSAKAVTAYFGRFPVPHARVRIMVSDHGRVSNGMSFGDGGAHCRISVGRHATPDDLLDDWQQDFRPAFDGIRIVGHRWSARSNEVRDFLARHFVPYEWLDLERNPEAKEILATNAVDQGCLPLVLLPDGKRLIKPSTLEVAQAVDLKVKPELPHYDLV